MAKLKSSKKSHRGSVNKEEMNDKTRVAFRAAKKAVTDAIKSGKMAEAKKLMPKAYSEIDKAAKKHVLHKNTAARYKAALAKLLGGKK